MFLKQTDSPFAVFLNKRIQYELMGSDGRFIDDEVSRSALAQIKMQGIDGSLKKNIDCVF
jgi:hypothetical protein